MQISMYYICMYCMCVVLFSIIFFLQPEVNMLRKAEKWQPSTFELSWLWWKQALLLCFGWVGNLLLEINEEMTHAL